MSEHIGAPRARSRFEDDHPSLFATVRRTLIRARIASHEELPADALVRAFSSVGVVRDGKGQRFEPYPDFDRIDSDGILRAEPCPHGVEHLIERADNAEQRYNATDDPDVRRAALCEIVQATHQARRMADHWRKGAEADGMAAAYDAVRRSGRRVSNGAEALGSVRRYLRDRLATEGHDFESEILKARATDALKRAAVAAVVRKIGTQVAVAEVVGKPRETVGRWCRAMSQ